MLLNAQFCSTIDNISGNCTISSPCDVGKGICTSDNVCKNNLKCGDKNCKGKGSSNPEDKYNCCFTPKG